MSIELSNFKNIKLGISRFKNIDGVSCYIVSILHILQQIPDLITFIKHDKYKSLITNKITDNNLIDNFIIYELSRVIKASLENDNLKISPYSFKKLIGKKNQIWSDMEHQDSQEFYTFLLTHIEEECGQNIDYISSYNQYSSEFENKNILQLIGISYIHKSESKDYSPLKNLFFGYLVSNIKCSFCFTLSPCFESFLTLPLSIPIMDNTNMNQEFTLEECLNNFINDEQLDNNNLLTCDICRLKNQSIKKIQIWKSPKILVIQLKRFITNMYGTQTMKIVNPIVYPIENLDIYNYFHPDSPYKTKSIYNLIGINIHYHISISVGMINAGHYVSIVKNKYNNKWYLFDDAKKVNEVDINQLQNRNAYLLFYYRNE